MLAIIRKSIRYFKSEILPVPSRLFPVLFCTFLFFLPLIAKNSYLLLILSFANIYSIFAVSWDLLSGYTGQFCFGHALFFGVAAYTCAVLNLNFGLSPWITIPIGALTAVAVGLIVGVPCLRLRGIYLSLATVSFPTILLGIVFAFPEQTGGELGLYGITPLSSPLCNYYLILILMLVSSFIVWKIVNSRIGIIFQAIREGEVTARASGINTAKYKLLAFIISGFFAGLAGGVYAHWMRTVGPSVLTTALSFQIITMVILGGLATIYGAIGGAYIVTLLTEYLRFTIEWRVLLYSAAVAVVLICIPRGILVWLRDRVEKLCPKCKKRNLFTRRLCRSCGVNI